MKTIVLHSAPSSTTMKLNLLGKAVYTLGFASGTISKCASASASIIKADYNQLRTNLKSL